VGFIPTSWYPADVDVTPDGKQLVVTNINNSGAGPNRCGELTPRSDCPAKDPDRDDPGRDAIDPQYSGSMIKGSISVIGVPRTRAQLRSLTEEVKRNNQVEARAERKPRSLDAIKHVIYVIKENRTYDHVFGDLPRGNGDPSLNLFKDDSAPNHRELARRFTLIDNFYAAPRSRPTATTGSRKRTRPTTSTRPGRSTTRRARAAASAPTTSRTCRSRRSSPRSRSPQTRACRARPRRRPSATSGTTPTTTTCPSATTASTRSSRATARNHPRRARTSRARRA